MMEAQQKNPKNRIFILCEFMPAMRIVKGYLDKRDYIVDIESEINIATRKMLSGNYDYIFISMSHSNKLIAQLPKIIVNSVNSEVIAFLENQERRMEKRIKKLKIQHKIYSKVNGPTILRYIQKVERGEEESKKKKKKKQKKSRGFKDKISNVIKVGGSSFKDKIKTFEKVKENKVIVAKGEKKSRDETSEVLSQNFGMKSKKTSGVLGVEKKPFNKSRSYNESNVQPKNKTNKENSSYNEQNLNNKSSSINLNEIDNNLSSKNKKNKKTMNEGEASSFDHSNVRKNESSFDGKSRKEGDKGFQSEYKKSKNFNQKENETDLEAKNKDKKAGSFKGGDQENKRENGWDNLNKLNEKRKNKKEESLGGAKEKKNEFSDYNNKNQIEKKKPVQEIENDDRKKKHKNFNDEEGNKGKSLNQEDNSDQRKKQNKENSGYDADNNKRKQLNEDRSGEKAQEGKKEKKGDNKNFLDKEKDKDYNGRESQGLKKKEAKESREKESRASKNKLGQFDESLKKDLEDIEEKLKQTKTISSEGLTEEKREDFFSCFKRYIKSVENNSVDLKILSVIIYEENDKKNMVVTEKLEGFEIEDFKEELKENGVHFSFYQEVEKGNLSIENILIQTVDNDEGEELVHYALFESYEDKELEFSKEQGKLRLDIRHIERETEAPFDIYIYLDKNERFYKLMNEERTLFPERIERLKNMKLFVNWEEKEKLEKLNKKRNIVDFIEKSFSRAG